jgi:two-component system nitrate/nitrite response regulator NarL
MRAAPKGTPPQPSTEVVIVVKNRIYRECLAQALGMADGIEVVGSAPDCLEATSLIDYRVGTVVLVDVSDDAGADAVEQLRRMAPGALVLALGVYDTAADVIAYAEAGITGYVTRDGSLPDLVRAIIGAPAGEMACSPRLS